MSDTTHDKFGLPQDGPVAMIGRVPLLTEEVRRAETSKAEGMVAPANLYNGFGHVTTVLRTDCEMTPEEILAAAGMPQPIFLHNDFGFISPAPAIGEFSWPEPSPHTAKPLSGGSEAPEPCPPMSSIAALFQEIADQAGRASPAVSIDAGQSRRLRLFGLLAQALLAEVLQGSGS